MPVIHNAKQMRNQFQGMTPTPVQAPPNLVMPFYTASVEYEADGKCRLWRNKQGNNLTPYFSTFGTLDLLCLTFQFSEREHWRINNRHTSRRFVNFVPEMTRLSASLYFTRPHAIHLSQRPNLRCEPPWKHISGNAA